MWSGCNECFQLSSTKATLAEMTRDGPGGIAEQWKALWLWRRENGLDSLLWHQVVLWEECGTSEKRLKPRWLEERKIYYTSGPAPGSL
jgi:hypothetical protein